MDKVITILVKPGLGKCGKNVTIQKGVTIRYPKNIQIENNVRIGRNVTLVSESDYGTLIIKKNVQINNDVHIDFSGCVLIEEGVTISEKVKIFTHDHGHHPRSSPVFSRLRIEKNSWLGANSCILPKVKFVGNSSIVGYGATLSKDLDSNFIYVTQKGRYMAIR